MTTKKPSPAAVALAHSIAVSLGTPARPSMDRAREWLIPQLAGGERLATELWAEYADLMAWQVPSAASALQKAARAIRVVRTRTGGVSGLKLWSLREPKSVPTTPTPSKTAARARKPR